MSKLPKNYSGRTEERFHWACLCWELKDKGAGCLSGYVKKENADVNLISHY